MLTSLLRTIDPVTEPVSLEQAQAQCRIVGDDDDALLLTYLKAAREHAESQTGRAILQQTWRLSLSTFPRRHNRPVNDCSWDGWGFGLGFGYGGSFYGAAPILLPRPRLIGIVAVTYLDLNGTRQTLDPSLYVVNADATPATLTPTPGTWWPASQPGRPDAVQVTYTAGYGNTAGAVPARVQLAILGLVGHWYENREAVVMTNSTNAVTTVPKFVDDLLADEVVPLFTYED